jgi:uncharacterized membrane protein YvbJ
MKDLDCPNCGGSGPDPMEHGDYRCKFCGTVFRNDKAREQKIVDERRQAAIRKQELQYQAKMANAIANQKTGVKKLLIICVVVLVISFLVLFFLLKNK